MDINSDCEIFAGNTVICPYICFVAGFGVIIFYFAFQGNGYLGLGYGWGKSASARNENGDETHDLNNFRVSYLLLSAIPVLLFL